MKNVNRAAGLITFYRFWKIRRCTSMDCGKHAGGKESDFQRKGPNSAGGILLPVAPAADGLSYRSKQAMESV